MAMAERKKSLHGFTIVELSVVIIVLGILATLIIVSIGSWRTRVATSEVKSDLISVKTAMESVRNFGSGYPTAIPQDFIASSNVEIKYKSGDSTKYCIDGRSKVVASVYYFMDTVRTGGEPRQGTCASGEIVGEPLADGPGADPAVVDGNGIDQITVGTAHRCGISSGKVYCWGSNVYGQLGNNSTVYSGAPVAVDASGVLSGKTVTAISAGWNFTCALADGEVYCWGRNDFSQLGVLTSSMTRSLVPISLNQQQPTNPLAGKAVTTISAASATICAMAEGKVYCWGSGSYGVLGNGTKPAFAVTPAEIDSSGALAGKTLSSLNVRSDPESACVLADGKPYCWGSNMYGGLGIGNTDTEKLVPTAVDMAGELAGKTVTMIRNSCLIADGKAYCWGLNDKGRVGDGTYYINRYSPVPVDRSGVLAGKTVTYIASTASSHTCVVADGDAFCWGNGQWGQMGNGQQVVLNMSPVAVSKAGVFAGKSLSGLALIGGGACTTIEGDTYCWGSSGPFGDGTSNSVTTWLIPTMAVRL